MVRPILHGGAYFEAIFEHSCTRLRGLPVVLHLSCFMSQSRSRFPGVFMYSSGIVLHPLKGPVAPIARQLPGVTRQAASLGSQTPSLTYTATSHTACRGWGEPPDPKGQDKLHPQGVYSAPRAARLPELSLCIRPHNCPLQGQFGSLIGMRSASDQWVVLFLRDWLRYCRRVHWTKMVQNGPNDHLWSK